MGKARIFLLLFFYLISVNSKAQDTSGKAINEIEFSKRMKSGRTTVLDVRTPDEFKESHIKNAINFNVMDSLAFEKQIATIPKNKKYLLYCRGGVRSGKALLIMQQKGFKHLYHLSGGILAWTGEIEKPKEQ